MTIWSNHCSYYIAYNYFIQLLLRKTKNISNFKHTLLNFVVHSKT